MSTPRLPVSTTPSSSPFARRDFLRLSGTAAALAFGAPFVRAADKSGSRAPVLGSGEHAYEALHDWGDLPEGMVLGNTHGVAVDAQGRIYVKHTVHKTSRLPEALLVFDPDGKFITAWGAEFRGGAHGLHLAREGGREFFYLCDVNRKKVVKTTLEGVVVWERGCPDDTGGYKKPEEYTPTNVATAPDGTVFVTDGYGRYYIHAYRPDGTYLRTFGGAGKNAGHMMTPHGIFVDTRGPEPLLVVADRSNRRLQYFTLAGVHVKFVTDELRAPCHFDTRGSVLLVPDLESRITLFDAENRLITHLGDGGHYKGIREGPRSGFTPGKFVAPHAATFDAAGNIFVVEWVEVGRITKLRKLA